MTEDKSQPQPADDLIVLRQAHTDLEAMVAARTAELRQTIEQKTALLHEVDHRVKNNLQLIASLLLLQTRRETDPAVRKALCSMLERINAVATVHRRLFQSDDVAMFDIAAFVRDLADDTLGASGRTDIKINLDTEQVQVPATLAAPLALVVNELLINAINHGFPPGRPHSSANTTFCGSKSKTTALVRPQLSSLPAASRSDLASRSSIFWVGSFGPRLIARMQIPASR